MKKLVDANKIIVLIQYAIDYEEEKANYDFDAEGKVIVTAAKRMIGKMRKQTLLIGLA